MKLPEDFGKRVFEIFDNSEISEPLISVYTTLEFMVSLECDAMYISHDVTRYISNGSERILPTVFGGDYFDDCIGKVFERDELVQELFVCEINKEILITLRGAMDVRKAN